MTIIWECCSDLTQDQKFVLENMLPDNRDYKVEEFCSCKQGQNKSPSWEPYKISRTRNPGAV